MNSQRVRTLSRRSLFIAVVLAARWLADVQAAPSGLNVIPTADFYAPGLLSLEYQSEGEGLLPRQERGDFALLQAGVARGLEVGVDDDLGEDAPALFNAKLRLLRGEGRRPALAVGLQHLGHGRAAQPYVVAGWGFGRPLRGHLGAIALEGAPKPMLGADYTWRSLTLQADWVGGRDNAASVGLSWAPHPCLTVTYAALLPNSGEGAQGHLLNLQYLVKLW